MRRHDRELVSCVVSRLTRASVPLILETRLLPTTAMPLIEFQRNAHEADQSGSAMGLFADAYSGIKSHQFETSMAVLAGATVIGACILSKGKGAQAAGSAMKSLVKPGALSAEAGGVAQVVEHAPVIGKVESALLGTRGAMTELSAGVAETSAGLTEVASGLSKRPPRINVKAIIRDWQPEDTPKLDAIAKELKVGRFVPGGWTQVLEAEGHGVVGYVGTGANMVSDCAVLPAFRNRSLPLLNRLLTHMKEEGGTWGAHVRDATSGRLINALEKRGTIQVLRKDVSPMSVRRNDPYSYVSFKFNG